MVQKLQPNKEVVIDGQKYVVQLYSPTFGLELYAKLLQLLGEPLVKLIGIFKGKDVKALALADLDLGALDLDAAAEALQTLFLKLDPAQFPILIQEILSSTFFHPELDLVSSRFETEFAGRYLHLFKLVAKTLGVQYSDFLSGIVKRSSVVKSVPPAEVAKAKAMNEA